MAVMVELDSAAAVVAAAQLRLDRLVIRVEQKTVETAVQGHHPRLLVLALVVLVVAVAGDDQEAAAQERMAAVMVAAA
jgi:hypothetical protein